MKRYIFLVGVTLSTLNASEPDMSEFNPSNTVVAFDLHNVLVNTDYRAIVGLVNYDFGKKAISALPNILLKLPWWLSALFSLKKQYPSSYLFPKLAEQYTFFRPLVPTVISMTNQQKVKPGIPEILRKLKEANYMLALASNITDDVLRNLEDKGDENIKMILGYFSSENRLVPSSNNNWLYKAKPEYFQTLQSMFPEKRVIFFDDKPSNRKAAENNGILAFDPGAIQRVADTLTRNAQKVVE